MHILFRDDVEQAQSVVSPFSWFRYSYRFGRLFSDNIEKIRQPSIRIIADDDSVDGCQKVEEVSVVLT